MASQQISITVHISDDGHVERTDIQCSRDMRTGVVIEGLAHALATIHRVGVELEQLHPGHAGAVADMYQRAQRKAMESTIRDGSHIKITDQEDP